MQSYTGPQPLHFPGWKRARKNVFPVRCVEVWNFLSRQVMGIPLFEPFSTTLDRAQGGYALSRTLRPSLARGSELTRLPSSHQQHPPPAHSFWVHLHPCHLLPCNQSNPIISIARQQQKYTCALSKYFSPSPGVLPSLNGFLSARRFMCYLDDGKSALSPECAGQLGQQAWETGTLLDQ